MAACLSENRFVRVKVYGMLGNEVADLVNEKHNAGNYEAVFDRSKLSCGTYYYTMSIDGKIIATKRMILLK